MTAILEKVKGFFVFIYTVALSFILETYAKVREFLAGISWIKALYDKLVAIWPFQEKFSVEYVILILVAVLLIVLIIIICSCIKRNKKRKVTFIVNDKVYSKVKTRYKKKIALPVEPKIDGFNFIGWYKDKACTMPLEKTLRKKKNIYAYAKFEEVEEVLPVTEEVKQDEPVISEP